VSIISVVDKSVQTSFLQEASYLVRLSLPAIMQAIFHTKPTVTGN